MPRKSKLSKQMDDFAEYLFRLSMNLKKSNFDTPEHRRAASRMYWRYPAEDAEEERLRREVSDYCPYL